METFCAGQAEIDTVFFFSWGVLLSVFLDSSISFQIGIQKF